MDKRIGLQLFIIAFIGCVGACPTDTDNNWCVEMKIPFRSLTIDGSYPKVSDGSIWKVNFSRVQWPVLVEEGKYIKQKKPATGKFLSEDNWVWSPQGLINMHYPERWGLILFTTDNGLQISIDEQGQISQSKTTDRP